MKKIKFLVVLLLAATQLLGQSKKELLESAELEIDSLTNIAAAMQVQLDSISKTAEFMNLQMDSIKAEKELYYNVYATIKEEVIKYDFDPAKTSFLIDSLRTSRDSTYNSIIGSTDQLNDTIAVLMNTNMLLQAKLDSISQVGPKKEEMVKELTQLKELLEKEIISKETFESKRDMIMKEWQ